MVAQYKVLQTCFIEPNRYEAGTIIEYDGSPGPHLQPLNREAEEATDKWISMNPLAQINPTAHLPMTVGLANAVVKPEASPVYVPGQPDGPQSFENTILNPGKAQAGLTDGGEIVIGNGRQVITEDGVQPETNAAGVTIVADPPGIGTNAPTVSPDEVKEDNAPPAIMTPAPGDASLATSTGETKVDEKAETVKEEVDKANTEAAKESSKIGEKPKLSVK